MARIARYKKTATLKKEVLEAFELCGIITNACKKIKIGRRTFYNWLDEDPEFREAYENSLKISVGVLEDEAKRRAITGTIEPVYYQGVKVGTVRKYSDVLLIVLLKAHAPEKYKERFAGELTGKDGKPLIEQTFKATLKIE